MIRPVAELVAERVGRPASDLAIRTWAGAVIGVAMSWLLTAEEDPTIDWVSGMMGPSRTWRPASRSE
jgi:hypothetical protein